QAAHPVDTEETADRKQQVPQAGIQGGWKETVEQANGGVRVKTLADAEPGTSVVVSIQGRYPGATISPSPVALTVYKRQAQENTPGYEDGSTTPGNPVTVPQAGYGEVPADATCEVPV
ncbi:hypothetical protein, partial [Staphylococcus felis]|uniref:hypothetical protein n=1 Tax=Staphylococcus felis TaxID=46127 RepID=UPI000E3B0CC3